MTDSTEILSELPIAATSKSADGAITSKSVTCDSPSSGKRRRRRNNDKKAIESPEIAPSKELQSSFYAQYSKAAAADGETENSWEKVGSALCWICDEEKGFVEGEVISRSESSASIRLANGELLENVDLEKIQPMNPPKLDRIQDMANLSYLNEASVFHNLKLRYLDNSIYTYSGLFLVAVNPYKVLPIYGVETSNKYFGKRREQLEPHVFATADAAYRQMLSNNQNQSILITGESGAGKTENTKKVIQYLTHIAGTERGGGMIEQQLLRANPLLEAFGNAKTLKNNNSSRFGKFIEIDFNPSGFIIGCRIQNYLLESTRVCFQNKNERSFHFFYQLTSNEEMRRKYKLGHSNEHFFLNQSGCTTVKGINDEKEFFETLKAMEIIGITEQEKESIQRMIAGIIHLGDIVFEEGNDSDSFISNKESMMVACELLEINPKKLESAFCHPTIKMKNEIITKNQTAAQAAYNRDALAKSLYHRLFDWLVKKVNETLTSKEKIRNFIGVLDIAGFEIFENNSFEQLCINYTNEKLQQFFNHTMFRREQEEYMREGIEWTFIDFGLDLQPTIDLIEKNNGILSILDNSTFLAASTDQKMCTEIIKTHKDNAKFKRTRFEEDSFVLSHYAGEVTYNCQGWLSKNVDPLNDDSKKCLFRSKVPFISTLFASGEDKNAKSAPFRTIANLYKSQLKELMALLNSTEPHFIRCILPNLQQQPRIIEPLLVLNQLRCNGVLEGIRISRKGYPGRIPYEAFLSRYGFFAKQQELDKVPTLKRKVEMILKDHVKMEEGVHYQLGLTKVFLKTGVEAQLEDYRELKISQVIVAVQAAIMGWKCRNDYKIMTKRVDAIKTVQKNWRAYLQLKNKNWWILFQRARPLLATMKQEDVEKKRRQEMEELKKALEAETNNKSQLADQKAKLEKELQILQAQAKSATERLSTITDESSMMRNQIAMLTDQMKKLETEKAQTLNEKTKIGMILKQSEDSIEQKARNLEEMSNVIKENEKKLAKLQQELEDKSTNLSDLKSKQQFLEENIKNWRQKHDDSQQTAKDLAIVKARLEEKVKDYEFTLENMQKGKLDVDSRIKNLLNEVKEKQKKMKELSDSEESLRIELNNAKKEIIRLEEKVRSATEENEALGSAIKSKEAQVQELTDNLNEKTKSLSKVEMELKQSKTACGELLSQIDQQKENLENTESQLQKQKIENGQTKSKLAQTEEENTVFKKKLEELALQTKSDASKIFEDLSREKKNSEKVIQNLNESIAALNQKIEELERDIAIAQKKNQKIETDLKATKKDLEAEKMKNASLNELNNKISSEKSELSEKIESNAIIISDLEQKSKSASERLKTVEEELEESKRICKKSEDKVAELKKQIEEEHELKQQLEDEKDALLSQISNKDQSLNKTSDYTQSLKDETERLKKQVTKMSKDCKDLEEIRAVLEEQNQKIQQKLKNLEEEKKNLSAECDKKTAIATEMQKRILNLENEAKKNKSLIEEKSLMFENVQVQCEKLQATLEEQQQNLQKEKDSNADFAKKLKQAEFSNSEMNSGLTQMKDRLILLEKEKKQVQQQAEELGLQLESTRGESDDWETKESSLKTRISELSKALETELSSRMKKEQELVQKIQEFNSSKDEAEQESSKQKEIIKSLKDKIDAKSQEKEQELQELVEERNNLKKELRILQKRIADQQDQQPVVLAIDKKTAQLKELASLSEALEEERSLRAKLEQKNKQLCAKLEEISEFLDDSEKKRKQIEAKNKALESENEELRVWNESSDELKKELSFLRVESAKQILSMKQELSTEIEVRKQKEETILKMKTDIEALRAEIDDSKNNSDSTSRKIRKEYEQLISELESELNKMKKEKLEKEKLSKKFEKEVREIEKINQEISQKYDDSEIEIASLERTIKKSSANFEEISKKNEQLEQELKKLRNENENLKERAFVVEMQLKKTSKLIEKEKSKNRKIAMRMQSLLLKDSDENFDLNNNNSDDEVESVLSTTRRESVLSRTRKSITPFSEKEDEVLSSARTTRPRSVTASFVDSDEMPEIQEKDEEPEKIDN